MIFDYPITTSANTPKTAPLVTILPIQAGRIIEIQIQVPSGNIALSHLQILYGLHQLFPTNADGDFATSSETIAWSEDVLIGQPPFELKAITWNLDTVFDHTVTVRIVVQEEAVVPDIAAEIALLLGQAQGASEAP